MFSMLKPDLNDLKEMIVEALPPSEVESKGRRFETLSLVSFDRPFSRDRLKCRSIRTLIQRSIANFGVVASSRLSKEIEIALSVPASKLSLQDRRDEKKGGRGK